MTMPRLAAGLAALAFASCGTPSATSSTSATSDLDKRFLEIAAEYPTYGVVDTKFGWVQTLCRVYSPPARFSESHDASTHGDKLYLLYAKDWNAYVAGIREAQPEGQVIVKEAWEPSPVTGTEERGFTDNDGKRSVHPAERDGRRYTIGARHGLFIMFKDAQGWHYGTATPDGARVVRSGAITSCVGCHQDAKPDSLFGLPGRPQDR